MTYAYAFIGPEHLRPTLPQAGKVISDAGEIESWLRTADEPVATFTVGLDGKLRLSPRRSEHVACSGGLEVLSAGELGFGATGALIWSSNQSTGFCPDVDSWSALEKAAPFLARSSGFTRPFLFRRCARCAQVNVVKDAWFVCVWCDADLPQRWNVGNRRELSAA